MTNSTEWKPRQTAETTTAPSDVDEAWRSNLAQQNQSSNAVTQDTQSQSFSKVLSVKFDLVAYNF